MEYRYGLFNFGRHATEPERVIHPEDLTRDYLHGTIWRTTGDLQDGYIVVEQGRTSLRVLAEAFVELEIQPEFFVGDEVLVDGDKRAVVHGLEWHIKRNTFYYILNKSGRESTGWYFPERLSAPH